MKELWHAAVAVASIADSIALHVRIDMQTEGSGGVSLTFCDLSKIISRKYTMSEITFMMRISS